ncbi:MAG: transposase [Dysgonamonadaceae bacterium]|nr:transposase [Dysgonamonadaceae bacterium]
MFGRQGYISTSLFETLFSEGIRIVTEIKSNMNNLLMTLRDKIFFRKRSVI